MEPELKRLGVYDWLRGYASIAVLICHFKPVPKMYAVWSVNVFVMVTMALLSRKGYDFNLNKVTRRLSYLAFAYFGSLALFHAAFGITGAYPVENLQDLFSIRSAFSEHPYFGNIWYIALYLQLIAFLFLFFKHLHNYSAKAMLIGTFLVGELVFFITHAIGAFRTITLFSWVFWMALGFHVLPRMIAWREEHANRLKAIRITFYIVFIVLYGYYAQYLNWFLISENRTTALVAPIFLGVVFILIDLYYLASTVKFLTPLVKVICFIGRYTLTIYISHTAFSHFVRPHVDGPWGLTFAVLLISLVFSYGIHQIYLFFDNRFLKHLFKRQKIAATP